MSLLLLLWLLLLNNPQPVVPLEQLGANICPAPFT
jgi:hypothetical protein